MNAHYWVFEESFDDELTGILAPIQEAESSVNMFIPVSTCGLPIGESDVKAYQQLRALVHQKHPAFNVYAFLAQHRRTGRIVAGSGLVNFYTARIKTLVKYQSQLFYGLAFKDSLTLEFFMMLHEVGILGFDSQARPITDTLHR